MKRIAPIALAAVLLMGCKTTTPISGPTPDQLAAFLRTTVPTDVAVALQQAPESREYLAAAARIIRSAATDGSLDPTAIMSLIQTANSGAPINPLVSLAIANGLGVYALYFSGTVSNAVNSSGYVVVLFAVADGIDAGLAQAPQKTSLARVMAAAAPATAPTQKTVTVIVVGTKMPPVFREHGDALVRALRSAGYVVKEGRMTVCEKDGSNCRLVVLAP